MPEVVPGFASGQDLMAIGTITTHEPADNVSAQPRVINFNLSRQLLLVAKVATGQNGLPGPGFTGAREILAYLIGHRLGQLPEGGDLAPENGDQGRLAFLFVYLKGIVPGSGLGGSLFVIHQWPDTGVAPHHVFWRQLPAEVLVDDGQQVIGFFRRYPGFGRVALVIHIVGTNQGEVLFVRDDEDDAL